MANGLVMIKSAAERVAEKEEELTPETPERQGLAAMVEDVFAVNRDHRKDSGVEDRLLECRRRVLGQYSDTKAAQLEETGQPVVWAGITGSVCRDAKSWLEDVFSRDDYRPWRLTPTPMPEIPPAAEARLREAAVAEAARALQSGEVPMPENPEKAMAKIMTRLKEAVTAQAREEAQRRAGNMETLIADQMLQGRWERALDAVLDDLTTSKAAILKGPVVVAAAVPKWSVNGRKVTREVEISEQPRFMRVDPVDFYPSPGAVDGQGPGPSVERVRFSLEELDALLQEPAEGWNRGALQAVLTEPVSEPADPADRENRDLSKQDAEKDRDSGLVTALEFWGLVQGDRLLEGGLETDLAGKPLRHTRRYCACLIVARGRLLFASVNPDPAGVRPYSVCGWAPAGGFWYQALPELMEDVQDVCNAAVRAFCRNAGFASGPQIAINDISRIPAGGDVTTAFPFKVWQFANPRMSSQAPLEFFNVDSRVKELSDLYFRYKSEAADRTGVPSFGTGSVGAEQGRTHQGLLVLMSAEMRRIRRAVRDFDRDIIKPAVNRLYVWNMLYHDDDEVRGDLIPASSGAVGALMRSAAASSRMEFLQLTSNPEDMQIVGRRNRARLLREIAQTLEFGEGQYTLTDRELAAQEERQAQQAQQAQMMEMQLKEAELQLKQAELELKNKELDIRARAYEAKSQTQRLDSQVRAEKTQAELALKARKQQADEEQAELDTGVRLAEVSTEEEADDFGPF